MRENKPKFRMAWLEVIGIHSDGVVLLYDHAFFSYKVIYIFVNPQVATSVLMACQLTGQNVKMNKTRVKSMARLRKSPRFPPKANLKDSKKFFR